MPLTIRQGTPVDAAVIAELNSRMSVETEGKTLDPAVVQAGVAAALADPALKGPYYLADQDGQIVGQLQITYEWSDWRNGWFWWIQGVYVRPEQRRRGVFKALYEHVDQAAKRDPEVIGLRLYVEKDNVKAQQAYAALGMVKTPYWILEKSPLD